MADYSNILNALGKSGQLSAQQVNENFDAYRKLTDNGVSIPDLLKKIQALEQKVETLEKPVEEELDAHLFSVMESSVRDDLLVNEAKRALQDEKTRVISRLCMEDEEYRKAFQRYRQIVNKQYVSLREKSAEPTN